MAHNPDQVAYSFGLEIDGFATWSASEIHGLEAEQDVIELKEQRPDGRYVVRRVPGPVRGGEVVVVRSVDGDGSADAWLAQVRAGDIDDARRTAVVILYDVERQPLKRYVLRNVWPRALEVVGLVAGGNRAPAERITLVYDAMEPETV